MNSINNNSDIIIALATPYGKSAIAVLRLSGKNCIELVEARLKKPLKVGRLTVNEFRAENFTEKLMAVCYRAPHSYTGQDVVELMPHGNMTICDGIVKSLIADGARIAERGEFTLRAFLNGKVDLMQCEALADIIDAQTSEQLVYGNKRYENGFKSLEQAQKLLKTALSSVEAVLHYGDELESGEASAAITDDVYGAIDKILTLLNDEKAKYAGGRIINDGFKVALIGAPNVGKSTLLNSLAGRDRAIVTPIAGTTRDTVEDSYVYEGKKFVVTDTAGLNDNTSDEVEKIGIERAKEAAENADAVVLITAGERQTDISEYVGAEKPIIEVVNKCDDVSDVGVNFENAEKDGALKISAKLDKNVTALKAKIFSICPKSAGGICNHRQFSCLNRCISALEAAKAESGKAEGLEIVAAALYDGYSAIEELYGENADEKVIGAVFDRFCVGK